MYKSQYFTNFELSCKCCGVFNMTEQHIKNIDVLRKSFGKPLKVTSGCRCKKNNDKCSTARPKDSSRHQCTTKKADATDLMPLLQGDLFYLYHCAKFSKLFGEVILYHDDGFVHVATGKGVK